MSEEIGAREYEVGYAKPPRPTRFQKGRSGNSEGAAEGAQD